MEWQHITCNSGFAMDDHVDVSSEEPKGLMRFLNEWERKFQENERGSATSGFGGSDCCWSAPCMQFSSP